MKKIWNGIVAKLGEWFSLDYRSMALLRIGVGLTLIFDLIQRSYDLRAFYTDSGVLPRVDYLRLWNNEWWISLHMAGGLATFEAILFIIAAIFAVMLLLGYRTRFAMIMSWFFLVSLHLRNPTVLQGGDILFRVILFWMMFLPLGQAWSLDRLFNRVPTPSKKIYFSMATVAYIVQVCLLYLFTGLLKTGTAWHDGTAVYYALNVDQLITPMGAYLREFPAVMSALTYATWYLEVYGVLLFFSPVATSFFRTLGIILFAGLQIGFNTSMRLGLFGMIAIVITLGLIPTDFWDSGWSRFSDWIASKGKKGLTIYYDFECSFCHKATIMLKRVLLLNPETKILPAHEEPAVETLMLARNSWVIVDGCVMRATKWSGFVMMLAHSPLLSWTTFIARAPFVTYFGDKVYESVSKRRKMVCVAEPIEAAPTPKVKARRTLVNIFVAFCLLYAICWNIDTLGLNRKLINPSFEWFGWTLHLDQKFNMFAPTPLLEDGWYVMPGTLQDGSKVDVFSGKEVSYEKPQWVAYTYKNQRWQKYLMNLWSRDFAEYRQGYGKYLCREWNANHSGEKRLETFDIIFMLEVAPAPGQPQSPVVPTTIWSHHCF